MAETAREFFEELAARTAGGAERTRGVIAPLVVVRRADDDYLLLTEQGLGDVIRSTLLRARFAAKVEIEPEEHTSILVFRETDAAADCVISAPEELFLRIVRGEQSPMGAFLMGKIRVEGDPGLAMRLKDLLG